MKLIKVLVISIIFDCCQEHKPKDFDKIKSDVISFSDEIESGNISVIKNITTDRGLYSILVWSDSLRNHSFLNRLSQNIKKFNVFEISDYDSLVVLSMGKSNAVLGATGGYIFLRKENINYKIDLYRGGK